MFYTNTVSHHHSPKQPQASMILLLPSLNLIILKIVLFLFFFSLRFACQRLLKCLLTSQGKVTGFSGNLFWQLIFLFSTVRGAIRQQNSRITLFLFSIHNIQFYAKKPFGRTRSVNFGFKLIDWKSRTTIPKERYFFDQSGAKFIFPALGTDQGL